MSLFKNGMLMAVGGLIVMILDAILEEEKTRDEERLGSDDFFEEDDDIFKDREWTESRKENYENEDGGFAAAAMENNGKPREGCSGEDSEPAGADREKRQEILDELGSVIEILQKLKASSSQV